MTSSCSAIFKRTKLFS